MISSQRSGLAFLLLALTVSACAPPTRAVATPTPRPGVTENAAVQNTPAPPLSSLEVDPEALRGTEVSVWHPWFGAEASLFETQAAEFNTTNEWGIVVRAESKINYSELFSQTQAALEERSNPQVVIAFPEHAYGWDEHVIDLNTYVNDPEYGLSADDILDFPPAIWDQENVDGKRFGVPAQRTARFLLYNQTWARELGFGSAPATSADFEEQACAANRSLGADDDPNNNALGGWLIDTYPVTPLSWMLAFGGGVQEEQGYRFLTPGNIDAFKFVKVLQQKGCAWVPSADLPVYERFAARQALFATASLEEFSDQARAFFTAGNRDEWIILPFPGSEQDAFVVYGSSFTVFESDDVTQLASWLFVRWMLSPENQARWVRSTGLFPLRTSTMNLLADYAVEHPQWASAVELLPEGQLTPQLASWRVVRVMLGDGFRDMFDTIRHPDLTDGQVPLLLRQMEETATDLEN